MLPAAHRLRRSTDFAHTVRRGRRAGRGSVVVHLVSGFTAVEEPAVKPAAAGASPVGAGFAVPGAPVKAGSVVAGAPGVAESSVEAGSVVPGDPAGAGVPVEAGSVVGGAPVSVMPGDPAGSVVDGAPVRAGFVVSKAVGPAVVRNKVKRRLRHLMGERLSRLPAGSAIVVRAQPRAALAAYPELALDLDRAIEEALRPRGRR